MSTTLARNAELEKVGSHWISADNSTSADGIGKEEVFPQLRATWRGRPVGVTMSADRYAASHHDIETNTSTSRLVPWRIYAREAWEINGDDSRGELLTDTARAALGRVCEPLVRDWLNGEEYAASFKASCARMILRELERPDRYRTEREVATMLDGFRGRITPNAYRALSASLRAYRAYRAATDKAAERIEVT
jgi:hypothetical protein